MFMPGTGSMKLPSTWLVGETCPPLSLRTIALIMNLFWGFQTIEIKDRLLQGMAKSQILEKRYKKRRGKILKN